MSLHFENTAPGIWQAHDETGDYEVCVSKRGTHVHMDVDGPAGHCVVDENPRDSMAGFELCHAWWGRAQESVLEVAETGPRRAAA